jgi:hypothetical protein
MTLIDLIRKAAGPADDLLAFLNVIAQRFPDVAPKAQELAQLLAAGVTAEGLASLAVDVTREIGDIARGKITPASHPSDAA